MTVLEQLKANPIFAHTPEATLSLLGQPLEAEAVPVGKVLLHAGDPADTVYVLLSGTVRIFHDDGEDQQVTVKHLSAPVTFGEMEVLCGEVEMLESVEAITNVSLLRVSAKNFCRVLDRDPRATAFMLRDICKRFCVAARNERTLFYEMPVRLASLLLSYAELFGRPDPQGIVIRHVLTQDILARGLGVVVRSVRRTLTQWKQASLIEIRKGRIIVKDKDELDIIANGLRMNLNYRSTDAILTAIKTFEAVEVE